MCKLCNDILCIKEFIFFVKFEFYFKVDLLLIKLFERREYVKFLMELSNI